MGGLGNSIRKYRGRLIIAAVVVAIPVLALAWWLGSPLFINKTVDEEFPYSVGAVVPEGMTRAQVDQTMATMAMMEEEVSEAMSEAQPSPELVAEMVVESLDRMSPEELMAVVEALAEPVWGVEPEDLLAGMEDAPPEALTEMVEMAKGMAAMMAVVMKDLPPETMAQVAEVVPAVMASPSVVKRGMFRDADGFHKGEGSATVYELPDGSHVLRFEDFRVTNGPDLRVILASHPDPMSRGNVHNGEYVELAKLKGNIGNQNYPLPEGLSPGDYNSVIIYCKPFQVIFSVASLSDG